MSVKCRNCQPTARILLNDVTELLKVRQVPIVKMERSEAVTNVLPLIKQMIFQSRELLEKVPWIVLLMCVRFPLQSSKIHSYTSF
jgi:hypothetical protein